MAISSDERPSYVEMGERIARMCKAHGLTQTQRVAAPGVTQQTVQPYEAGARRITVSVLPTVARTLSASLMKLFGVAPEASARAGTRAGKQQHIEAIAKLPRSRQQFVAEMLKNALDRGRAQ